MPGGTDDKESLISLLDHKLEAIEHDLQDPAHYVNDIISNDAPKKNFYATWAEILELKYITEGTPEKIESISHTIRRKLISLGKDSKIVWMYESLPSKYKQRKYNPNETYGEHTNNSSLYINYELENKPYIDHLTYHIETCEIIRTKLKTTEFLTKKDGKGNYLLNPDRVGSDITVLHAADRLLRDTWDNRMAVSVYTQHFLVEMVARFNTGHATGAYLGYIKDFGARAMKKSIDGLSDLLSTKQVGKIMKGRCKELHARYDPKTGKEAHTMGFYGEQCTNCDSWRVDYETAYDRTTERLQRQCRCYGCNSTWTPATEMMPRHNTITLDMEKTV